MERMSNCGAVKLMVVMVEVQAKGDAPTQEKDAEVMAEVFVTRDELLHLLQ